MGVLSILSQTLRKKKASQYEDDLKRFHDRFSEDVVLTEGHFGVIKCLHDKNGADTKYVCKTLQKSRLPSEGFMSEIEILQLLRRSEMTDNFCIQLDSFYDSRNEILLVTELCEGGNMFDYVTRQRQDLRTEDISRIAHQLLTAVNHFSRKNFIHRNLTPENVLFQTSKPQSPLRVIGFGSGIIDAHLVPSSHKPCSRLHHSFYSSPEMFQDKYNHKTDVFSIGVILYVLVAGYPADKVHQAFHMLQSPESSRDCTLLPHMPANMPDSFYDLLEALMAHKGKDRKTAQDLLNHPFVSFHKDLTSGSSQDKEFSPSIIAQRVSDLLRRDSLPVSGILRRHHNAQQYITFERSLTDLLMTSLSSDDLTLLANIVRHAVGSNRHEEYHLLLDDEDATGFTIESESSCSSSDSNEVISGAAEKLGIIRVNKLMRVVGEDLPYDNVVRNIYDLPNSICYFDYAYDTSLLVERVRKAIVASPQQGKQRTLSQKQTHSKKGGLMKFGSRRGKKAMTSSLLKGSESKEIMQKGSFRMPGKSKGRRRPLDPLYGGQTMRRGEH